MSRSLRVLLGVTGGIAAYKSAEIVRRLRARGHEVRCALTRGATAFVTPLTLEVLTGHPVWQEEYLTASGSGEEAHITAAAWAQVLCVAPATSHTLARLALGLADDFLTTTALAFDGPLVVAPAMHSTMWAKPAMQQHIETLRRRGAWLAGPVEGPLASGEVGMGRMADPEAIVAAVEGAAGEGPLAGRTVLVTAGPTYEPLDPVRFLASRWLRRRRGAARGSCSSPGPCTWRRRRESSGSTSPRRARWRRPCARGPGTPTWSS
jgi:phosphopantothenoylcysteine decarboxylase/phosphopantothenate--cysteine ligase